MGTRQDSGEVPRRPAEISISRIIDQLPESVGLVFRRMMRESRRSREELRRLVATHLVRLESASRETDYIDAPLAGRVANLCHRLIDTIAPPVDEDHRRVVQAAVLYFALEEDVEGDTVSLIGLDDDQLVVDAVCRELGVDPEPAPGG
jgi:hypothetical protein